MICGISEDSTFNDDDPNCQEHVLGELCHEVRIDFTLTSHSGTPSPGELRCDINEVEFPTKRNQLN